MHKIKKSQVWISLRFLRFFQIFPVQTDPVLMLLQTCRTFSWYFCPSRGASREPSADQQQTAAQSPWKPCRPAWSSKPEPTTPPAGDNPGAFQEQLRKCQTQPEAKPILTERCKMRLKTFLRNHGKIYRKHIKRAQKSKYSVIEVFKAQPPHAKRLKAYRNKTAGAITNKVRIASRDLEA